MEEDNLLLTNQILSLSPLDGRYLSQVQVLKKYFSEFAINKYRIEIEIRYLIFFLTHFESQPPSPKTKKTLLAIIEKFDLEEAKKLKQIEAETKHDVKAVEYYLNQKLAEHELKLGHWIHFGLTSEDVNSLAIGLALSEALKQVMIPELHTLLITLKDLAEKYQAQPMLARTHGQPAVPTTLGKELLVFVMRLNHQLNLLKQTKVEAKLSGAVGSFNALHQAYPKLDVISLTDAFVSSLKLQPNHFTTQIIPAESYIELFHRLSMINAIIIDLDQDAWRYISDNYLMQEKSPRQVGSSTMPQKINPIDFENSEGNLGLANALLAHFNQKLPISRLQRDLSDSTVKRNFGAALGYCVIGYQSCCKGLVKIKANREVMERELLAHWEVVTEGIQTVLRQTGDDQAYEKLKELAQGKTVTQKEIETWVDSLQLSKSVKKKILAITPLTYTGLSKQLVSLALKEIHED